MSAYRGSFIPTSYNLPPPPPPSSRLSSRGKSFVRGGGRGRGKFQYGPTNLQTSRPVTTTYDCNQKQTPSTQATSSVYSNPECEKVAQAALAATSSLLYKNNANVVDNRSSSANGPPRCEACRTTFGSEELLRIHVERHRKCPQCDFRATLSNIREHQFDAHGVGRVFKDNNEAWVEMFVHAVALKPKMNFMLDTPEAIAIWIEERKKRYPTDANIAKKKLAEVKRIARGEVIDGDWRQSGGHKSKKNTTNDGVIIINGKRFDGTRNIFSDLSVAADRDTDTREGSSSRSPAGNRSERLYNKICIKYLPGHCPRGKNCGNRHEGSMICPPLYRAPDSQRVRSKNLRDMLLHSERAREKNSILQSLRYILENDFFDVISEKTLNAAKKRGKSAITEIRR
ncbi:12727_t:CDS:2 [Acaulospora colombiana]|uniref:12727_t:CDS:1 n=1 Tax=Acaulospora colombiana TaxID=27376 RepID=A0ACA9KA54_9GLOM|nr:12727_t:CDS:2 [Acaulospora colombiana]